MSRSEAFEQYVYAQKQGKKYYSACVSAGLDPYPSVLQDMLSNADTSGYVEVGTFDIPSELIVGTWAGGRKKAFAGNFMPLLETGSEFADKWINLCAAHLSAGGIRDPISCFEYLGKFYIKEGHKRASVLKSYGAPSIYGTVTRVIPTLSDKPEIRLYYEFLSFFKLSRLYRVRFSRPGSYARLQAALGLEPNEEWTDAFRRDFSGVFRSFGEVFDALNSEKLDITQADAFLEYLKVHPFAEARTQTPDQMRQCLSALWPDLRLFAKGEPIWVSTEPEEKEKSLLERIFGTPKLKAAFIYDFDPLPSAWASAHARGQKYLEEKLGNTVDITSHLCGEDADETMEDAIRQGANVLFATSPMLIDSCRRIAAAHKNVKVYNCSLSLPYAGVRSYYCRIYEGKFIAGAVAGAMAKEDAIGYVANYPIMGAIASVNAFALGAQLTNPRARILLRWSCVSSDPVKELLDAGVDVISNRDKDGARAELAWHLGTYAVEKDGLTALASPRWNWGRYYEQTIRSLLNGGLDAAGSSERAINDWWGISAGVADVDISDTLPDGVKQLALILKRGIAEESIDPFLRPIRAQSGETVSDGTRLFTMEELMRMDWLCDSIDGSIPGFDELMPRSQSLVRLLGIYRETIPPKAEENRK